MKARSFIIPLVLLCAAGNSYAQVIQPHDTIPIFMADSLNAVYIFADTGTAINKTDREGRRQGLWEKKYPDGILRYRGHFLDNNPIGVFKTYYDTIDSLQSIRVFSNDGKSAYTHMFYTTGALAAEGKYVDEKKDSIWKFYDAVQRMIRKDQYKNGKEEGKSVIFYSDGNVLEVKNWENDLEEGPFQQYFDEGGIKEEGIYVHGKLEDTLTVYDPDGKISVKGTYVNDMHEGSWIYYYDGAPRDTLLYHRGKCLNCYKFSPAKRQEDSLKLHYQKLQEQLDHPQENYDGNYQMPGGEE
jgi:antitoxin component YwqK of YwqJK toxin-antitoxin module